MNTTVNRLTIGFGILFPTASGSSIGSEGTDEKVEIYKARLVA